MHNHTIDSSDAMTDRSVGSHPMNELKAAAAALASNQFLIRSMAPFYALMKKPEISMTEPSIAG